MSNENLTKCSSPLWAVGELATIGDMAAWRQETGACLAEVNALSRMLRGLGV